MKRAIIVLALLMVATHASSAPEGRPGLSDPALIGMFRSLSNADGYTFRIEITTMLGGEKPETEVSKMVNYQSRSNFQIYSRSGDALFFSSLHGQLRVNFKEKTAFFRQYPNDSIGSAMQKQFMTAQLNLRLDSVFLTEASITRKEEDKSKIHAQLHYPAGSLIQNMDIVYLKGQFFQSITYQVIRSETGGQTPVKTNKAVVTQQVKMFDYQLKMPQEVTELLTNGSNILAYLQKKYPGYKISAI